MTEYFESSRQFDAGGVIWPSRRHRKFQTIKAGVRIACLN